MLVVVNDKASYNILYRKSLLASIRAKGVSTLSIGLLDDVSSFFKVLYYCLANKKILSSNLKVNVFVLMFCRGDASFIINGLGRFRSKRIFRLLFLKLLDFKKNNTKIIFQNYADFRYYRRFSSRAKLFWVPGSGGVSREIGDNLSDCLVVQRDSKIMAVSDSLREFAELELVDSGTFNIIGCSVDNQNVKDALPFYTFMGRYPQDKIFVDGRSFIQPEGYGEGIPHTLVDAICSGMNIYIKKSCFTRYGLHRLGFDFIRLDKGWGSLVCGAQSLNTLSLASVNSQYLNIIFSEP